MMSLQMTQCEVRKAEGEEEEGVSVPFHSRAAIDVVCTSPWLSLKRAGPHCKLAEKLGHLTDAR